MNGRRRSGSSSVHSWLELVGAAWVWGNTQRPLSRKSEKWPVTGGVSRSRSTREIHDNVQPRRHNESHAARRCDCYDADEMLASLFVQDRSPISCLNPPVLHPRELRMRRGWTPSIVLNGNDQTVYLVLCDYGPLGQSYCETNPSGPIWKPRSPTCSQGNTTTLSAWSPSTRPSGGPTR
jgi:hypothetical protein